VAKEAKDQAQALGEGVEKLTDMLGVGAKVTPSEAKRRVKKAIQFIQEVGTKAAFAEFCNRKGRFSDMDSYITVYDVNGILRAYPIAKQSIGTSVLETKDGDGKFFVRELIELVKAKGKGWVEYLYHNPASGQNEPKLSYSERIGDLIVSSGAYK
jgi:signal transduction histidine kinase